MSLKKKLFNYGFLLLMIGITVYAFLSNFEIVEIWGYLKEANPWWILFGVACMFLYIAAEGEGIRSICYILGSKFSFFRGFVYSSIDIYFCAVTPSATGGAPVMMYYMSKDDVPLSHGSMVAFLNTVMYTLSMVVLVIVSFIFAPEILFNLDADNAVFFYVCLTIGCVCSAGLITVCLLGIAKPSIIGKIGNGVISLGHKMHIVRRPDALRERLAKFCADCEVCSKVLRAHPGTAIWVLICNIVQRSSAFLIGYAAYLALGLPGGGEWHTFVLLFGVQAAATLATYAVPIPGGVGATELMLTALYSLAYTGEAAGAIGAGLLLSRGISYYLNVLFCGVISVVKHLRIMRKDSRVAEAAPATATTDDTPDTDVPAVAEAPAEVIPEMAPETANDNQEE